ncbi:MAG TPA: hypothetical protein VJK29_20780 [Terriglobales bacterium]|nr:hypothetical protein [Terriglobales bacterium]
MKALLTLAVLAVLTYSDSLVKKNTALKLSFRKHKPRRRCTHPNLRFWMDEWENQKVGLERTEMMCGLPHHTYYPPQRREKDLWWEWYSSFPLKSRNLILNQLPKDPIRSYNLYLLKQRDAQ